MHLLLAELSAETTVTLGVATILSVAIGLVTLGITWGKLTSRLGSMAEAQIQLGKTLAAMDRAQREDTVHFGNRWHEVNRMVQDHELQLALIRRELGIPHTAREDRTPVTSIPRRHPVTGAHGPVDPGESR